MKVIMSVLNFTDQNQVIISALKPFEIFFEIFLEICTFWKPNIQINPKFQPSEKKS